jgi:rod shape-determining protein MreD
MKKLILPFVVFLFFVIESTVFQQLLPKNDDIAIVPRLLVIALLFVALDGPKNSAIIYALSFGFLYDLLYTDIIGVYTFSFTVIVYLFTQLTKYLYIHFFFMLLFSVVSILILELLVYAFYSIIGITSISMFAFYERLLMPTIILNSILVTLFYIPLKKLITKLSLYSSEES